MKLALSFLGGSLFSCAAVVLAGGRPAGMLWLGAALALTTFGALVCLTGLRRVARFLNAFMDALEGAEKPARTAKQSRVVSGKDKNQYGWVKPSTKQRDAVLNDTISEYLGDDFDEVMSAPKTAGRVQ
jgi:hypothetical protein